MKLQILVNGHAVEVKSEDLGGVVQVEPGVYSVLVEGRSFEAEVRDPRDRGQKSAAALGSGRQNVFAPMPGKVIRVLVREGDAVDVGQGLVVVEAMKMQNEMKASRGGNVVEVRVRDGETVSAGDVLVVLG
jgi:biotin carboxyl carrier protein